MAGALEPEFRRLRIYGVTYEKLVQKESKSTTTYENNFHAQCLFMCSAMLIYIQKLVVVYSE